MFRGKSLRILVGTTPGAGYDLIARILAPALARFIPGNPSIVVENMPGAGSLAMMNYLYNRAPRDGTVIGLPLNGVLLEPTIKLMSRAGGSASFDIQKMPWIGSTTEDAQALWFRTDSKINVDRRSQNNKERRGSERAWRRQFYGCSSYQQSAWHEDGHCARLSGH